MNILISKIKIRRGTEAQRQLITLEQGELAYTTDSRRVFVGNGGDSGQTVGSKFFPPINTSKTSLKAYTGDIVNESNLLFQLTGTNATDQTHWRYIGPVIDNVSLAYDSSNRISVKTGGIDYTHFASTATSPTGGLKVTNQGLSANVGNGLQITNNTITLKTGTGLSATSSGVSTFASDIDYDTLTKNGGIISVNNKFTVNTTISAQSGIYQGLYFDISSGQSSNVFACLSSNLTGSSTMLHLTAMGFMTINTGSDANNVALNSLAIPIFRYA